MNHLAAHADLIGPDLLVLALILFLSGIPYVLLIGFIAARKGQSVALFCLLSFIPLLNLLAALWLASLTDATLEKRLTALESRPHP